jgi:hypothetical protein
MHETSAPNYRTGRRMWTRHPHHYWKNADVHSRQNLPRQRRDKRQEKSCGGRPHPYFLVGRGGILHGVQLTASPVTPYESWHRRRPYVSNLRFFDSIAYVHVPKEERSKLDKKISRRIFVFYKTTSKAWKGGGIQKAEP